MICLGLIFLSVLNERATKCHGACCQREGGGRGRGEEGGVILEESHRKGKLEPPRSMPQVFRKTEIRKHSTTETTGSAELRESSEAGGKPV